MKLEVPSSSANNSAAGGGGKTLREHILLQPEDSIGSVEKRTQKLWVYERKSITHRVVTYVPGLHKIFDEILVYAADGKQRDPAMNSLRVQIDVDECRISVYYNGGGIPIELHREEGVYMPEMIFSHIGNCDRNAMDIDGVKLANIFSTEFVIETVDGRLEKKYKQVFSENMGKKSEPQITVSLQGVNWTKITFKPDLAKFNMTHLEDDVVALMSMRVFDVAGILGTTVQVVLNGQKMPRFKSFPDYVDCYIESASRDRGEELMRVHERLNDQLEVCVSVSEGLFQQVSFVNKFATMTGGTHVDYVSKEIAARVTTFLNENVVTKFEEHDIKRYLWVFINTFMKNPTFDSPTREVLTTPLESSGSELSNLFLENVADEVVCKLFLWRYEDRQKTSGSMASKKERKCWEYRN